jgi:hypothetical protein
MYTIGSLLVQNAPSKYRTMKHVTARGSLKNTVTSHDFTQRITVEATRELLWKQ